MYFGRTAISNVAMQCVFFYGRTVISIVAMQCVFFYGRTAISMVARQCVFCVFCQDSDINGSDAVRDLFILAGHRYQL